MPNPENLIYPIEQTKDEAKKNGKKGGIASGIARRKNKAFRQAVNDIANMKCPAGMAKKWAAAYGVSEDEITVKDAMTLAQAFKAIEGLDTQAFNAVADWLDSKPPSRSEVTGADGQPFIQKIEIGFDEPKHPKG